MRKTFAAFVATATLAGLVACGSTSKPATGVTMPASSAPAQGATTARPDHIGQGAIPCPTTKDFISIVVAAEKKQAESFGRKPGSYSITPESDPICQDGFAAQQQSLTGKGGAMLIPGKFVFVLRQKYLRTGIATDTEWELLNFIPYGSSSSSICKMPPPPRVLGWMQNKNTCVD